MRLCRAWSMPRARLAANRKLHRSRGFFASPVPPVNGPHVAPPRRPPSRGRLKTPGDQMSKFYTIRSADGQRSYRSVTKAAAKGMVRRGEATFLPNCSVVQLPPPADPTDDKERQYKPRGISARPEAPLMHRYVLAKASNGDPL